MTTLALILALTLAAVAGWVARWWFDRVTLDRLARRVAAVEADISAAVADLTAISPDAIDLRRRAAAHWQARQVQRATESALFHGRRAA